MDGKTLYELYDKSKIEELKLSIKKQNAEKKKFSMEMNEASEKIGDTIEQDGPFAHNLVSCILRGIKQSYGTEAANYLVDYHDLKEVYGIHKI